MLLNAHLTSQMMPYDALERRDWPENEVELIPLRI